MGDSSAVNTLGNSASYKITGQIMLVAIIVVFVVVVFILFLHLYAKWFWWRIEQQTESSPSGRRRRRRSRFVFAPGQDPAVAIRAGLNPAVLKKIPVVAFSTQEFKDGLECAVCLCDLEDGEKARLLPKCNHGFHVECIDMWFQSHSTCPLCRNPVHVNDESAVEIDIQDSQESLESGSSTESSPNFPTNVLFWGNETQVSSGGACLQEGVSSSSSSSSLRGAEMLVIEIPPVSNMSEHLSSLSPADESKSPMTTRLRSLKRLLSREKRVNPCGIGSDCSTSNSCDVV